MFTYICGWQMKRSVLVVLATWSILLSPPCARAEPIRLVTGHYPPYEYEEGGKVIGMVVEIVAEAFRRNNQSVQIRVMPWARALREAQEGLSDGVFAAVRTPEREKTLLYSEEALVPLVVSLFVRKDAPIRYDGDLAKLSGYRFGVVNQFSNGPIFDSAVKTGVLKNVDVVSDTDSNVKKLMAGRIDIMVNNRYGAFFFLRKNNALDQVVELQPEIDRSPSYIAFTMRRDLVKVRDAFDKALAGMKRDGTYQRIVERYGR
ncbi:MAG TPA: transporter substrate-binding domain-containing protein [Noviherbaspirillum sp.]|nr:transporter substrate-binding domain-containing protein [Noviherbaspirillum sp.]